MLNLDHRQFVLTLTFSFRAEFDWDKYADGFVSYMASLGLLHTSSRLIYSAAAPAPVAMDPIYGEFCLQHHSLSSILLTWKHCDAAAIPAQQYY